jgi:hypothetical protein
MPRSVRLSADGADEIQDEMACWLLRVSGPESRLSRLVFVRRQPSRKLTKNRGEIRLYLLVTKMRFWKMAFQVRSNGFSGP